MNEIQRKLEIKAKLKELNIDPTNDLPKWINNIRIAFCHELISRVNNDFSKNDIENILLHDSAIAAKSLKKQMAISQFDSALNTFFGLAQTGDPLTEDWIKKIGNQIKTLFREMSEQAGEGFLEGELGYRKAGANHIRGGASSVPLAQPFEIPVLMSIMVNWYNEQCNNKILGKFRLLAELYYRFENTRPFTAYNNEMVNTIVNFALIKAGYAPILFQEDETKELHNAFLLADKGKYDALSNLIALKSIENMEFKESKEEAAEVEEVKSETVKEDTGNEAMKEDQHKSAVEDLLSSLNSKATEKAKLEDADENEEDELSDGLSDLFAEMQKAGGEPIPKSKEVVNKLILGSFKQLGDHFFEEFAKFESLYTTSENSIHYKKGIWYCTAEEYDKLVKETEEIEYMEVKYKFDGLKTKGVKDFNPEFTIRITPKAAEYNIYVSKSYMKLQKYYDESLSKKEIEDLVKSATNKHQSMIKEKIGELKNK